MCSILFHRFSEQKQDFEQTEQNVDQELIKMQSAMKQSNGENSEEMLQNAMNVEKEDQEVGQEIHNMVSNVEKSEEVNQEVSMAHIQVPMHIQRKTTRSQP